MVVMMTVATMVMMMVAIAIGDNDDESLTMVVMRVVAMIVAMMMATECQFAGSDDGNRAPVTGDVTGTDDDEAGRCRRLSVDLSYPH